MEFKKHLSKLLPVVRAEAHCDIPCGIYDPTPAKIAAKTVARMVDQLNELASKTPIKLMIEDANARLQLQNSIVRRTAVKEEHAQKCKDELLILWTDFFKPEHLTKFPNLHETFWKAAKLCSKNKQEVNAEAAAQLVTAVDEIAKMFYEAKGAPERYDAYKTITDKLY